MKNPFEKNDHKILIAGIIIGSTIVGAAAYLFLTETGSNVRQELSGHINRIRNAVLGMETSPEDENHAVDYLHHDRAKAPKSDREALLKHEILAAGHEHKETED